MSQHAETAEQVIPPGNVLCRDLTAGNKPPITMSASLGWLGEIIGRRDAALYILSVPPLIVMVVSMVYMGWWIYPIHSYGAIYGGLVDIGILIAPTILVGWWVIAADIRTHDLPRFMYAVSYMIPLPGDPGSTQDSDGRLERPMTINGAGQVAWVIPTPVRYRKDGDGRVVRVDTSTKG